MSQRVYVRNLGGTPIVLDTAETADLPAAASDTVAGKIEIAIQSEMETATDVVRAVVPGRQQFHPSAAKGWIKAGVTGNTIVSYNTSSVTDGGTGLATINWATDFSGGDYAQITDVLTSGSLFSLTNAQAAGTTGIAARDDASTLTDPTNFFCVAFGDLA